MNDRIEWFLPNAYSFSRAASGLSRIPSKLSDLCIDNSFFVKRKAAASVALLLGFQ